MQAVRCDLDRRSLVAARAGYVVLEHLSCLNLNIRICGIVVYAAHEKLRMQAAIRHGRAQSQLPHAMKPTVVPGV